MSNATIEDSVAATDNVNAVEDTANVFAGVPLDKIEAVYLAECDKVNASFADDESDCGLEIDKVRATLNALFEWKEQLVRDKRHALFEVKAAKQEAVRNALAALGLSDAIPQPPQQQRNRQRSIGVTLNAKAVHDWLTALGATSPQNGKAARDIRKALNRYEASVYIGTNGETKSLCRYYAKDRNKPVDMFAE